MGEDLNIPRLVLQLMVLMFSIILHEVAHGYVALRLGDPTAKYSQRLTLNPLDHIDLLGSIILPVLLILGGMTPIGWAKPVPVNPLNFRDPKRDEILVSMAGVATNVMLATVVAMLFRVFNPAPDGPLAYLLAYCCMLNLWLAMFNLIPVPPLDGSHLVSAFMPPRMAARYTAIGRFGIFIIYLLVRLLWPVFSVVLSLALWVLCGPIVFDVLW